MTEGEMEWLNIHTRVLDSEAFIGCEPLDRATWLCLMRYSIGQENGGTIVGCRDWGDRRWQQAVRVTLAEVNRACVLWEWKGKDLRVSFYPIEKEREVQAKREAAISTNALRKTKEGNGKEWNVTEGQRSAQCDAQRDAPSARKFQPPPLSDIQFQCNKIGLPDIEALKFQNFYESKGWYVGKTKMKNWRRALQNWKINWDEKRCGLNKPNSRNAGFAPGQDRRQAAIVAKVARMQAASGNQNEPVPQ